MAPWAFWPAFLLSYRWITVSVSLSLVFERVTDSEGHGTALLLKGDWHFVGVSDEEYVGWGEASLSGDDDRCEQAAREFFRRVPGEKLSPNGIAVLRGRWSAGVESFVTATAASALEQALHELVALREGVPVWHLYVAEPTQTTVPAYATINRALSARDDSDYVAAVERALVLGFTGVKCAPFERVTGTRSQLEEAQDGLEKLRLLRGQFPDLELRVDCHERFDPETFLKLLPSLDELGLTWIEAPCPIGPAYATIREQTQTPIAAGELYFGSGRFAEICKGGWADVIMPDVKHVGGVGPLLEVCQMASGFGVEVSCHNASGPVATAASLHCAAISPIVMSIEVALRSKSHPDEPILVENGALTVPDAPGWGIGGSRECGGPKPSWLRAGV